MPRPKRADEKNAIYHALDRGNGRSAIFQKPSGQSTWIESITRRLDLESTLRPRGRPRKQPPSRTEPPQKES